ncbi:hypothetical protein HDK77DRAFT_479155 [Phyllosticta capitalensis]
MEYDVERASLGLGLSSMVQPTLVTEEDAVYQNGYAGFASFLSQNYYQNFRRFKYLRMRILLRKQRKISCLEKQLQALDDFDTRYHPEWMISEQSDLNKQRDEIFESLEAAFSAYDSFLKKTEWILAAPQSSPDIINQTKEAILDYIIPDERHYLSRELDCFYVGGHEDSKIGKLLTVAENLVNLCLMLTDSVRKLSGLPSRPDRFYRSIIASKFCSYDPRKEGHRVYLPMDQDVENASSSEVQSQNTSSSGVYSENGVYSGYPGLANFLRSPEYMIFRRFTNVRIRLILRQQFEIRKLERELQILDQRDERDNIEALISQESDTNKDRERTLNLLKVALAEYDDLLQRNQWAMRVLEPTNNHVESTRNEFANLIVRSEAYFADGDFIDLCGQDL